MWSDVVRSLSTLLALGRAQTIAGLKNADEADPEHLLLAILSEPAGIGCQLLKRTLVDLEAVRRRTEEAAERPGVRVQPRSQVPFSRAAGAVIGKAKEAAREVGWGVLRVEWLLLSLASTGLPHPGRRRAWGPPTASRLGPAGSLLRPGHARVFRVGSGYARGWQPVEAPLLPMCDHARRALRLTEIAGRARGIPGGLGSHVMLGLIEEPEGVARRILRSFKIKPEDQLKDHVVEVVRQSPPSSAA